MSLAYGQGTVSGTQNTAALVGSSGAFALVVEFDEIKIAAVGGDSDALILQQAMSYWVVTKTDDQNVTVYPNLQLATFANREFVVIRGSLTRQTTPYLVTEVQNLIDQFGSLIDVGGVDRVFTLNKTASGDDVGFLLQQGGADVARFGLFATNNARLQLWFGAQWNDIISAAAANGHVTFPITTDASAYNNAPAMFSGGVGIAKKLYLGSNLYLPNGGVITFNADTLTHSAGMLTFSGIFSAGILNATTAIRMANSNVIVFDGGGNYIRHNDASGVQALSYGNAAAGNVAIYYSDTHTFHARTPATAFMIVTSAGADIATQVKINGTKVIGTRDTGWSAQTATASKIDLGAAPSTGQLASWASAVQAALTTHGILGA